MTGILSMIRRHADRIEDIFGVLVLFGFVVVGCWLGQGLGVWGL